MFFAIHLKFARNAYIIDKYYKSSIGAFLIFARRMAYGRENITGTGFL
jgi:hypothetical protein